METLLYLIIILFAVTLLLGIFKRLLKLAVFCAVVLLVLSILTGAVPLPI